MGQANDKTSLDYLITTGANLRRKLERRPMPEAQAFIRQLMTVIRGPHFPRPHSDVAKLVNVYGGTSSAQQLLSAGGTPAQAQALAVKQAYARFGKEAFGRVDDFDTHQAEIARMRNEVEGIYEQMRTAMAGTDLNIDTSKLTATERASGLARVTFRRAPAVSPAQPDWPRLLIEDFERAIPATAYRTKLVA